MMSDKYTSLSREALLIMIRGSDKRIAALENERAEVLIPKIAELEAQILDEQKETLAAKALDRDLTLCERDNAYLRVDLANAEALLDEIAKWVASHGRGEFEYTRTKYMVDALQAILDKREQDDE